MKKEEYLNKKSALKSEHENAVRKLAMEFVKSNSDIMVGDFIKDHIGTIKVESISVGFGFSKDFPDPLFRGQQYTTKGKPFKNYDPRTVWGGNVVSN